MSRLGIADYDYVDVSEHPVEERPVEAPVQKVASEPVPIRSAPLSVVPPPEPVSRAAEPPARVFEPEPVVEEEEEEPVHTTISGPSFLGLTDSDSNESEYLLQDDQPRRRGGLVLLILLLAAIGVAAWLEWPKIKSGEIHIPYLDKLTSQTNSGSAPASNEKAVDQADNSDEKLMTNDPTLKDQNLDTKTADRKPPDNSPAPNSGDATAATASTLGATGAANAAAPANTGATKQPTETKATDAKPASSADTSNGDATDTEAAAPSKPAPAAKTKPSARAARATDGGPDPSQNANLLLGEKYLYGRGAPQDCNQAMSYFRKAANDDNVPAMSHLGAMYASGNCVTMNRVTAYTWLAKAQNADPGNHWRERNMNMLWRDMTPQERAAVSK